MAGFRGYARGKFGQVHFGVHSPDSGPWRPLVLCHQSPSSHRQFDPVYPLLTRAGFMAIGVDNPGFGNSDVSDQPTTIQDFSDAVISVMDELGVAQADILGQHTGSMVAVEATLRHPTRFRRLVLNAPTPFTPEERQSWLDTLVERQKIWTLNADGTHLQALWDRRMRVTPGFTSVAGMHRMVVQMLVAGEKLWYGHNAALRYDEAAALMQVKHPSLLLTNTGDAVYEVCKRAFTLRPDIERVELQGGTHDIVDEQPVEWTAAVAGFLNRP